MENLANKPPLIAAVNLARLLLFLALPTGLRAQFSYVTNEDTIGITGYDGPGGPVQIPQVIHGLPVTSIEDRAFSGSSVTDLAIPDGVTRIGDQAFASCGSLTNAAIGHDVTHIGDGAFSDCGLTSVTVPDSVTFIADQAFAYCRSLTQVAMGNRVTGIGEWAFSGSGLTWVSIPDSVTRIGDNAFADCSSLSRVTIGHGVTNIGSEAFYGCSELTSVLFKGNAPALPPFVFAGAPATVYYLPGSTGWRSTFDGCPALRWNPRIDNASAACGVHSNQFGFSIIGDANCAVVVEACTNLADSWFPVGTNFLLLGTCRFNDACWTNHRARFYRLSPW